VPVPAAALRGVLPPPPGPELHAALPLLRSFLRRFGFAQLERRCFGGAKASAAKARSRTTSRPPTRAKAAAFSDDEIPF
jgi:hypothetical protein